MTNIKPMLSTFGGTSDARFIKDYCPVFEFGPISKTAHQVDEHIKITELEQLTEIYYKIISRYFN
jgi:succinyl-diaminopimelate desuccinylase